MTRVPRRLVASFGVLPDFLIIGAQKGGTTSLYQYLARHPHVAPARRKEVHFFDRRLSRGIRWYRSYFPARHLRWFDPRILTGESTPMYLFDPSVPELARRCLPQAKLIALLRNPVDRAYSHYQMACRNGEVSREFDLLVREYGRLWPLTEDAAKTQPPPNAEASACVEWIRRGLYARQLRAWLRHFPREQMLVLNSEAFFLDPQATLNRVTRFLGLQDYLSHDFPTYNGANYSPVSSVTRSALLDYFRPHNEDLYKLLDERFDWDH